MTRRRDASQRRRVLIADSRVLLVSAHALLHQARRAIARQQHLKVVCAWCTRTIRWRQREASVPHEVSHGICRACAAALFRQLQTLKGSGPTDLPSDTA